MSFKATITPGTQFKILDTTPILLEQITSLTPFAGSRPSTEVTPISATKKTYRQGRPAYGKATGEVAFDPTDVSHLKLLSLYNAAPGSATIDVELALTDNGSKAYKWTAFVDEFGLSFPNEGPVKAKFSWQATTGATAQSSPTSVTPSTTVNPLVAQGSTLSFYASSAYTALKGVENIELAGGARDTYPATPIEAAAAVTLPGYTGQTKLSFNLEFDSTEAAHLAMLTSFNASTPVTDRFKITFSNTSNYIQMADCNIVGWAWPTAPGVNVVKVDVVVNSTIAIS